MARTRTSHSRARTRDNGTTNQKRRSTTSRKKTPDFNTLTTVAQVVTKMRQQGVSLTLAAKESGVPRDTIVRIAGSALRRNRMGRYVAAPADQLPRLVRVPDKFGTREIVVRNSTDATRVAELWNAVHTFLATGNGGPLEQFRGSYITDASGHPIPLFIGRNTLKLLGRAGVLSFESIYARAH